MSSVVSIGQRTKGMAFVFERKWGISISSQSTLKINEVEVWPCSREKPKAIVIVCSPKWLIVIICQSTMKINEFEFWPGLVKEPRLWPYCSDRNGSFASLVNLE